MTPRPKIAHHVAMDPPVYLGDNDRLIGKHFVIGGAMYGRVLFTVQEPAVWARGSNIEIKHCYFENLNVEHVRL